MDALTSMRLTGERAEGVLIAVLVSPPVWSVAGFVTDEI